MIYASIVSRESLYNSKSHQGSLCNEYINAKVKSCEIALIFEVSKLSDNLDFFCLGEVSLRYVYTGLKSTKNIESVVLRNSHKESSYGEEL